MTPLPPPFPLPLPRVAADSSAFWQRHAHAVLGRILAKHGDLTPLRWQLAPYGCGVLGEIAAPPSAAAVDIERVFAEWVQALSLALRPAPKRHLLAGRRVDACHITITATLPGPRKDTA
ncbi:hypothetical protein HCN51_31675 [Nonomuraea sp. FMUSA5-5]|uniref:Uncharacterized protein n=1 Tax=Nonomuraea composti TaxID=2720023 RepID=A0ABX1B802_9ACTN|nr:hypothetical protein [Nonomuraea sp. FMUSA5-5]NJP93945.1 hypothetical protein [Nonomuraea sp. FMUSA5-5]